MESSNQPLVSAFWRGNVRINPDEYSQWKRIVQMSLGKPDNKDMALKEACALLPTMSAVVRHNVQRILIAALTAEKTGGRMALVEGCRSNSIDAPSEGGKVRRLHRTGSEVGALILRLLQTNGVISREIDPELSRESRCTDWEADALLRKIPKGGRLIGIAGPHNEPSEQRAQDVVSRLAVARQIDADILSLAQAIRDFHIELSDDQQAILAAAALTESEQQEGEGREEKNLRLQRLSNALNRFGLRGKWSAIAWMARLLPSRWDKPRRQLIS